MEGISGFLNAAPFVCICEPKRMLDFGGVSAFVDFEKPVKPAKSGADGVIYGDAFLFDASKRIATHLRC